jgi:hypothetical protein
MELDTPDAGEKQLTSLITSIWQATILIWKERCDILHQDTIHSAQHTHNHLRPQVLALYEMKPKLDTIDRRVLDTTLRDTLKLPKEALQDWIK